MIKAIIISSLILSSILGVGILDVITSEYDQGTITKVTFTTDGINYSITTANNGNISVIIKVADQLGEHNIGDKVTAKKNILGIWRLVGEPI